MNQAVEVLYFASLRDALGVSQEKVALEGDQVTVLQLLNQLSDRGETWRTQLLENAQLQVAVNHEVASRDTRILPGQEVAFFPPVTGG
jgi:molybdopterin synthase sulfur carrier subunit